MGGLHVIRSHAGCVCCAQESSHNPLKWLPRVDGGEYGDGGDGAGGGGRGRKRDRDGDGGAKAVSFAVQRRIMQVVASDPELRQLASDAFRSFVRAYATHSAANKAAIHVKNLHLGHVAFAHALKVWGGGRCVCRECLDACVVCVIVLRTTK